MILLKKHTENRSSLTLMKLLTAQREITKDKYSCSETRFTFLLTMHDNNLALTEILRTKFHTMAF